MNKKFSTLLAAALLGTFSANAIENNELYQLKIDDKVLSVVKNTAKTADSLVVVDAPDDEKIMAEAYKKSLWKFTKGKVDNTPDDVWKITNYATGNVLSLDLSKGGASFVEGGQSQWMVSNGEITAIKSGKTYAIYLKDIKDKEDETKVVDQQVLVGKDKTAYGFKMEQPKTIEAMSAAQINGLYGTSSVFDFVKDLAGNPIDGVAFRAKEFDENSDYVTFRLNSGKYLVVDSTTWTNSVNDFNYWKLTTDALPTDPAADDEIAAGVEGAVLENGRMAEFYAFKVKLNIAKGYQMTIYPLAVPVYANTAEENGKQTAFSFGQESTQRALVYGKFADSKEVITATSVDGYKADGSKDETEVDKLEDALAAFGVVEAPDALDPDYVYYVQDYNKYDMDASEAAEKLIKNKDYKKYYMLNCVGAQDYAKTSFAIPAYMWSLEEDATLANMMNTDVTVGEGAIYLIDEEAGLYAFDTDTVKLTKGPKVEDARNMGYKVVTKADEVNGALSFRLVSSLADDLYMISKNGVMFVANSELADAQKLKVVAAEEEGEEYATVGNKVVKPVYMITDRLGEKVLTYVDGKYKLLPAEDLVGDVTPLVVSFLAAGKENQYKIVYNYNDAITANAATGILEEDNVCATDRVIFEFATKEAPKYGAPAIGHVQITTLEDDNKMIANQKDGFAALKSEGQSILKSDVYTQDTLTMWLDTACTKFDETMPLYYISTKTFTAEAETRNFLVNPANFVDAINKANEEKDPSDQEIEDPYTFDAAGDYLAFRAAFNAASVCGVDSIAINGDTIDMVELNPAAIAFEVAAEVNDESYRIVSKLQAVNYDFDAEEEESEDNSKTEYRENLYLAQLNNVLYWTDDFDKAEIFVINRAATPTSNEGIEAEASVKVIAGNGTVTVQGAAGQNVTIATVLGKVVANEVVSSDNATIAAPAGVVFVTVNGETAKVVVK